MKNKNYPATYEKDLKQVIRKLKATVRRQANEKKKLKQELQTLKDALDQSMGYIDERLVDIPVEDIVSYLGKRKRGKLDHVEQFSQSKSKSGTKVKPSNKLTVTDETRQETIDKWKKWNEDRSREDLNINNEDCKENGE